MTNQYNHIRHRSRTSSTMSRRLHLGWGRILSSAARYHECFQDSFLLGAMTWYLVVCSAALIANTRCKSKWSVFLSMRSMSLGSKRPLWFTEDTPRRKSQNRPHEVWFLHVRNPPGVPVFVSILMIGSQQGQISGSGEKDVSRTMENSEHLGLSVSESRINNESMNL